MQRIVKLMIVMASLVIGVSSASALSSYVTTFNSTYPAAASSALSSCVLCHINPGGGGTRNAYGNAFLAAGHSYTAIQSADSDGDGFTNLAEIQALTFPGNAASKPAPAADTTAPTVSAFVVPATAASLTVTGISVTASDNIGVTGYLINESATAPSAAAAGWSATAPASYTFATAGAKTLYAYAKDAAGNVSAARSAAVTITIVTADTTAPTVTGLSIPATSSSLTVAISALTATDNVGVTGYIVNESATAPSAAAAGWSVSVPTSYTFAAAGAKTLYAYAKDAAGNVSTGRSASVTITISTPGAGPIKTPMGLFDKGVWYIDSNGDGILDPAVDTIYHFGQAGDMPVVGDWNGDGKMKIGVFRISPLGKGLWFLDMDGNGIWNAAVDTKYVFGQTGDVPVVGDWNGDGKTKIGLFRISPLGKGVWFLDINGNGLWEPLVDKKYNFGQTGDVPVAGDWNGDGKTKIGLFRISPLGKGVWFLDTNGNGLWDAALDNKYLFGATGDIPVVGSWSGTGKTEIGVRRAKQWILDYDASGSHTAGDMKVTFGSQIVTVSTSIAVTGQ